MHSRRPRSKPVELAFRDKPESYQAAYRNLVRVFIDDNLTEAFIDRLMPFSNVSTVFAVPPASTASSSIPPAYASSPVATDTSRLSLSTSKLSTSSSLASVPTPSEDSTVYRRASSEKPRSDPKFFSFKIVTEDGIRKNVETYKVSAKVSFNDISKYLMESFSSFVDHVLKPDTARAAKLNKTYGKKKYLPLNLSDIQRAGLMGKSWNNQVNPLDQPIFENQGLVNYFLKKPESFVLFPETDEAIENVMAGYENLQVRVTYGNPNFDKIITMRASDFANGNLHDHIFDKLDLGINKTEITTDVDSKEDFLNVVLKQTFPVRVLLKILIKQNGEEEPKLKTSFYSDATKAEIIGDFFNDNLEIVEAPVAFSKLQQTDPLFKLTQNLFKDNNLLFTVKTA